jgi:uncharacterized protein YidB (DUF937 family)
LIVRRDPAIRGIKDQESCDVAGKLRQHPSPTGVRIAGDRYQWLAAWSECVAALDSREKDPITQVGVEVADVGALDDVVVRRESGLSTYIQVKYAVNASTPVNAEYLIKPTRSGGPSLLEKTAAQWIRWSEVERASTRIVLLTNRAPDARDPLIAGRDARSRLLLPNAALGGPGTKRGRARESWAQNARLNQEQLLAMLEIWEFDLARDVQQLEEHVRLRMEAAGLRADDDAVSMGLNWITVQVINGVRGFTSQTIIDAVRDLGLYGTTNARAPRRAQVLQLRSLAELDPIDLGVHPALEVDTAGQLPDLPRYVPRDHDARLREVAGSAAGGESGLVVVVGGSSTGKTRACQEMVASLRGCMPKWSLWQPINPEAVLAGLGQVGQRTVVWLDEAQEYLETPDETGERVAAGLRELLRDKGCRPVLVVATLWPDYWNTLTTGAPDRHPQARKLLSGRNIDVPESFAAAALGTLEQEARADPRLAEAAARAADGQITQYLAGGPFLLDRYKMAPPGARALITAAMDARRLGGGPHLPLALLKGAAPGYLTDTQWDLLDDHWLDQALAYAGQLCNGIPGPLTRIRPRNPGPDHAAGAAGTIHDAPSLYRLADYLDQYGRRHRHVQIPGGSFWTAAPCAHPADLTTLARAAEARGLYHAAAQLLKGAAARGDPHASAELIEMLHNLHPDDHRPAQWAIADVAFDLGDPAGLARLLGKLRNAGAQEQVIALADRAAKHVSVDDPEAVITLLRNLEWADAWDQVTVLSERAAKDATLNDPAGIAQLLDYLRNEDAQDQVTALLARDPAAHVTLSDPLGVARLLDSLRELDAQDHVSALLTRDPAAHVALGAPGGVARLLDSLREVNAQDQVSALLGRDPAAHVTLGHTLGVRHLLGSLRQAGARDQVTALEMRAAVVAARDQWTLDPHDAMPDEPLDVAILLRNLLEAGAPDQVAALLTRDPAAHVNLGNARGVAGLLENLLVADAQDQVTALLARDPAAHVTLDDPAGIASLLGSLRKADAQDQVTALADRAAKHVSLGHAAGIASLLGSLREADAPNQVTTLLARDPAAHVILDDPDSIASLLDSLREADAPNQVTTLLARDPAAHVILDDPDSIASLLDSLRDAGAQDQVMTLADRAAKHVTFRNVSYHSVPFYPDSGPGITGLLDSLREAGAQEQATELIDRFPGEGLFEWFQDQGNHLVLYRFGRNPDGSPAEPWGWEDLD